MQMVKTRLKVLLKKEKIMQIKKFHSNLPMLLTVMNSKMNYLYYYGRKKRWSSSLNAKNSVKTKSVNSSSKKVSVPMKIFKHRKMQRDKVQKSKSKKCNKNWMEFNLLMQNNTQKKSIRNMQKMLNFMNFVQIFL